MTFFLKSSIWFFRFSFVYCNKMPYTTLSTQEKPLFQKEFLNKTIFYSVHPFAHIQQHHFSKYWGDQCIGHPPTSNFGGPSPQSPPEVSAPASHIREKKSIK